MVLMMVECSLQLSCETDKSVLHLIRLRMLQTSDPVALSDASAIVEHQLLHLSLESMR